MPYGRVNPPIPYFSDINPEINISIKFLTFIYTINDIYYY